MRKIALLIVLCTCIWQNMYAKDVTSVRKIFYAAAENSDKTDSLLWHVDRMQNPRSPIAQGYRAMYHMLKARYSYNPISKVMSFRKGRSLLDGAITAEPSNVELRFLRLSVQMNAPSFLDYSGQVAQDKKAIVNLYPAIQDNDLKQRIKDYMASIKIQLS